jgi:nitrous oxide reductase accessory protein NosL
MFKKLLIVLAVLGLFISSVNANGNKMFQTVNPKDATLVKKDSSKNFCNVCGMHLTKFYKTSHVTTFKNGNKEQYCSLHCQANIHSNHGSKIKSIQVVDTKSLKLINDSSAFYVVGSSKKGTMSPISKYAFAKKDTALTFQKKFGGTIHNFEEALEIAKSSMKKDNSIINKKRTMMAKKGKKIYAAMCKQDKYPEFNSVGETKQYLIDNKVCKKIKAKMLQAVSIYLYDPVLAANKNKMIKIKKDEKCPVCGMFIFKYPKWVAQIEINKKDLHSFDGVKDMMKFYFNPKKFSHNHKQNEISKMMVTDYYSLNATDAKKAFYVSGSNIYGPMGEELIPFKTLKEANDFSKSHYGKKVLKFDEIKESLLY